MEDDLPGGVCIPCFRTVRIAYNFVKQFKESNRQLLDSRRKETENVCKQEEPEYNDENIEEIIIEYSKDFDGHVISNTENINIIGEEIEDANSFNQEFSVEEKYHTQEEVYNNGVKMAEEQSDEEYKNVPPDDTEDEFLQESQESNFVLQGKSPHNFTCPVCRESFTKFEMGFVKHLSTHKDVKLKCNKCSLATTLTMGLYIQHFREAHRFQCHICSRSYGRRSGLCYHIKTHRGRKIYKCSYEDCGKSFLTGWCLRKHLHTHSESAKYVCSECGTEFKTYGSYKYHQKTHDGNRNYLCTSCGQTFLQLIHLKYHMWKHTGIKMFQCDKCHKRYTSQTQLKKHKRRKNCGLPPTIIRKNI